MTGLYLGSRNNEKVVRLFHVGGWSGFVGVSHICVDLIQGFMSPCGDILVKSLESTIRKSPATIKGPIWTKLDSSLKENNSSKHFSKLIFAVCKSTCFLNEAAYFWGLSANRKHLQAFLFSTPLLWNKHSNETPSQQVMDRDTVVEPATYKLWQAVNQSTVNSILYQIIKSAHGHLIFPLSF